MALTDQPYLPLYVDDWMNNNKLKMCSPAAHGLMVSIMCIMHKEKTYGRVLLKQKFKQTPSNVKNFALQIAKLSAFDIAEIEKPFDELIAEGSLEIEENYLICPRMVRDFETSEKRAIAGRKGGTTPKIKKQIKAKPQAKGEANTVNEIVIEDVNVNAVEKGKEGTGEKPNVVYPFDSDAFAEQWAVWKQYRTKEHKFRFRSVMSEQAALTELGSLAKEYANAVKQIAIGKNLTAQELKDLSEKGFAYAQQLAERKSISKEELEMLKKTQMERSKIAGEEKGMVEKQTQALEKIQKDTAAKLQAEKDKREAAEEKRKEREEQRRQKEQQIMQDAIEKQKLQLSLFIEQQGIKARSMQEELELAEKLAERKKAIALAEYKASKKTANDKLALDIANQAIANELAQTNVNAAVANAEKELKVFIAASQSKLKEGQLLSEELYEQEKERLNKIAEEEKSFQKIRLEKKIITDEK